MRRGRAGDPAAVTLAARLRELKLPVGRLKTGTPPRLDARTIDFSLLEVQPGDQPSRVSLSSVGASFTHAASLVDRAYERAHPRDHPRRARSLADVSPASSRASGRATAHRSRTKVHSLSPEASHQIFLEPEGALDN
jgi:tRNA uridine 5-carboxymethylaminomethyl modification enzyme